MKRDLERMYAAAGPYKETGDLLNRFSMNRSVKGQIIKTEWVCLYVFW